ncbi:SusE domain-containing protein [Carboxylicivirga sp. N1Y90]|uniref:SusE domain-containing protein n=1 Tax=Carboxylicivirga fragile TaxID=3417571 RepID=UPI003D34226F|nr:SusE domain-containing protein [Marinilabiliaceae bacterium N1Y90]
MKSLNKIFLFFAISMMVVSSCSEDKEYAKIMNPDEVDAPSVTAPSEGEEFVLSLDDKDELAMIIRWDKSDFGIDIKMDFSVDIDVKDGDFTMPINLALTTSDSLALTQEELNKKLLELGLSPGQSADFDIRVKSTVNYQIEDKISEIVTVSGTPYSTIFPSIYMIGAGVGGWDPALAVEVAATEEPKKYYTKAYFIAEGDANFRFFTNPDWGSTLGGWDVFPNYPIEFLQPKEGDGDPNFEFIGTTGWYELWVDEGTGTIQMKATTEPWLYLTGDATHGWGWDDPTKIKWVGHEIWEGDVTFNKDGYFRLFEQADWGPVGYGHDIITTYNETYIIIAEGHGDPNWQFIASTGSYHVLVNKRTGTFSITAN